MPLTPQSRVYEDKLARNKEKNKTKNAFANERKRASKKPLAQFITTPSGQKVNLETGEIKSAPYDEAQTKLMQVRPAYSKKASSAFSVKPKDVSNKTKLSGKDYARLAATGDTQDPNIEARPTGNARTKFYTDYVMKERIRKINAAMKAKGRTDILPTSGKEYKREINRLMLDFKSRYPGVPLEEAHIMHVNPKSGTGTNTWGNLKLGPEGLNWDQNVAHPSAFRQLPASEAVRFGAQGYGTASSWEGTPEKTSTIPRTEINPNTGLRKPVGPVGLGLKGLGAAGNIQAPITLLMEYLAAQREKRPMDPWKALAGMVPAMPTATPAGYPENGLF